MKIGIASFILALFSLSTPAGAQSRSGYNLGVEFQIGYPTVGLTNPDNTQAYFDGVAIRGGLNVPIFKSKKFDTYLNAGGKYLDLENTANNAAQYEAANLIGLGGGLSFRLAKFWFGGRYMQMWGRNYSTGDFSDRTTYEMASMEYFGGLYFQFDRLGVGVSYSRSSANIGSGDTGLESDTPYDETIFSIQATFDMGAPIWQILGGLF